MFVLIRAITYASIFIGLFLVFMPKQILIQIGINQPETIGIAQVGGIMIGIMGAVVAGWCIITFTLIGRGTPAPFDPPRRLVLRGPYRYVRNPMYIGASLVLTGVACYYQSLELLLYTGVFLGVAHLFVLCYEEPVLKRKFGLSYVDYQQMVNRWWPKL